MHASDRPPSVAAQESGQPLLDEDELDGLVHLLGAGPGGVGGILDAFVASSPPKVDEMRAAASAADWKRLSAAAHTLKGSSGTLCGQHLAELCGDLETAARRGTVPDAAERVSRIAKVYDETVRAMKDALEKAR